MDLWCLANDKTNMCILVFDVNFMSLQKLSFFLSQFFHGNVVFKVQNVRPNTLYLALAIFFSFTMLSILDMSIWKFSYKELFKLFTKPSCVHMNINQNLWHWQITKKKKALEYYYEVNRKKIFTIVNLASPRVNLVAQQKLHYFFHYSYLSPY